MTLPQAPTTATERAILVLALVLPTLVTWLYFVALDGQPAAVQQGAYTGGKAIQFALPVVWVFLVLRQRPKFGWPSKFGLVLGLVFGLAVMGAMVALYYGWLKPAGLFEGPGSEVRRKVASFGVKSAASYVLLAAFYSLIHSLLEEYYWRWFVFGHGFRNLSLPVGVALSSVGFSAHHVLVLGNYFGYGSALTWLFTLAIIIGGAFWAWLYRRTNSLAGPWLSHALVDATIFVIGWDLVRA